MKRFVLSMLAATAGLAQAEPAILHETQVVAPPPAGPGIVNAPPGEAVAIDGDSIIAIAERFTSDTGPELREIGALWYQRDGAGVWRFREQLVYDTVHTDALFVPSVAMCNGVAAVSTNPLTILERSGDGWTRSVIESDPPDGRDVAVSAGGVLAGYGRCGSNARYFEKTGAAWTATGTLAGAPLACDVENRGGPLELNGDTALVYNRLEAGGPLDETRVYRKPSSPGPWPHVATLAKPPQEGDGFFYGDDIALDGPLALVTGDGKYGTYVFRHRGGNAWQAAGTLRTSADSQKATSAYRVIARGQYVLQFGDGSPYVDVFRARADETFEHIAQLWPRGGSSPGSPVTAADLDGHRVVVANRGNLYSFDLPATLEPRPAPVADDFEANTTAQWQQQGGQFRIVFGSSGRVYQQQSLAGDAVSVFRPATPSDQAIEATIRPLEFQAADRWVGLQTRRTSSGNFYYVTWRSPSTIELKRMQNGAFTTLARRTNVPIAVNRNYQVRLQSIGSTHVVYVDGQQVLSATDGALVSGAPALAAYRARVDFDNVVVSAGPRNEFFGEGTIGNQNYFTSGPGAWVASQDAGLEQRSVTGDARAFVRDPVADQAVEARVDFDGFSGAGNHWFGLIARYVDDSNYYYVSVRNNGRIELRKLVNGQIQFMVGGALAPGPSVKLRLEAVGPRLRVFVNGEQVMFSLDSTFAAGGAGIMTYRQQARFSQVRAYGY